MERGVPPPGDAGLASTRSGCRGPSSSSPSSAGRSPSSESAPTNRPTRQLTDRQAPARGWPRRLGRAGGTRLVCGRWAFSLGRNTLKGLESFTEGAGCQEKGTEQAPRVRWWTHPGTPTALLVHGMRETIPFVYLHPSQDRLSPPLSLHIQERATEMRGGGLRAEQQRGVGGVRGWNLSESLN